MIHLENWGRHSQGALLRTAKLEMLIESASLLSLISAVPE